MTNTLAASLLGQPSASQFLLCPKAGVLTFERVVLRVAAVVRQLAELDIEAMDRVVLMGENGLDLVLATLGICCHCVCVPISSSASSSEIGHLLSAVNASALAYVGRLPQAAQQACSTLAVPRLALDTQVESAEKLLHKVSPGDLALILSTSGTTARPRLVPLQHGQLCLASRRIAQTLQLTSRDRCLQTMPLCHIHGLSTLWSTLISGGSYLCAGPFEVESFLGLVQGSDPTWFSAAPAFYAMMLEFKGRPAVLDSRLRFVRSASGPMPLDLWREVEQLFQCPLLQAYGMTEAGPLIASNTLDVAGRRMGSVGRPAGPEVSIHEGEIWIRGDQVCQGYLNQTSLDRQRFQGGWLATGDLGFLDEDGFLFVTGRKAEVINRGGEKISPQRVEAVLAEHPLVERVASFAVPHPTLGQNVGAAVVLKSTAGQTLASILQDIRQFAAASLPPQQIPQHWRVVDELPLGPGGKLQRSHLHGASLSGLWQEVLGQAPDGPDANFFEMGGHSLSAARLLQRIEAHYGVSLPLNSLFLHPTLAEFEHFLNVQQSCPGLPLTPGQRRLWFLEQLHPGQATYNMATSLWLEGPLELARLERALKGLWERHQALRLQLVHLPYADFPHWSDERSHGPNFQVCRDWLDQEEALSRAREAAARPFRLLQEPLFAAYLWRVDARRHLLLLVQHHMLSDGWSAQVLLRDLGVLYAEKGLAPVGSFGDYSDQLERLHQAGLEFWKRQMQPPPTPLNLFVDRSASGPELSSGNKLPIAFKPGYHRRLQEQARHFGVTPFVLMLSAFEVCLARQSGALDFVVGVAQAGRPDAASEDVVGFFSNTLPLRSDLVPGQSLRQLAQRVQMRMQQALQYPQVALEKLGVPVQVMLAYQNFPLASSGWPEGLESREFKLDNGTAKFELTLYLWEREGGLEGEWQHSVDRFRKPRLQGWTRQLREVLDAILDHPDTPWDANPGWLERFLEHTGRSPQSPALVFGEQTWSYLQIEEQSARVACFLQAKQMGPGHLVAVRLPRGPQLVFAILGVLRSGAAYLPLDPGYPQERLRQMLQRAPVDFVLDEQSYPDLESPSTLSPVALAEGSSAYVMFTSGSGGAPKAVPITHGNLNHYLVKVMPPALGLVAEDRYLHTASFSFSSSVRQLLLPLVIGAAVVLASPEQVADPELLWQQVQRSKVTVLDLIPSYSQRLLQISPPPAPSLRLLLSASEPLPVALAQGWARMMGSQLAQINMYGQTETCGIVCLHALSGVETGTWVPLGRPLPGVLVDLLEDGEIALDGPTLFAGYLGEEKRPPGSFRSGDLACLDAQGLLHFRGRKDRQLKARGVRIEPAEIEVCLNLHPWVQECKVVATRDQRLLAQVVVKSDGHFSDRELSRGLRNFLQARLPSTLVPHRYVQVDSLERNPNGKLVRPVPGEDALEKLWKELLQVEQVEPDDNFFESGGDSILSLTFVQRLGQLGHRLPLADLFRFPTFAEIRQRLLGEVPSDPTPSGLRRFPIQDLREWSTQVLILAGLRQDVAEIVAEVQLEASMRGQSTHALDSIPRYAQRLRQGRLNPDPKARFSQETELSALLDGDNGPGQWVATLAMKQAIEKAGQRGIGLVSVRGSNHFGAAGHYAWMALQAGLIGICTSNGPLILAPTGGIEPCLGNNPLAVGIPAGRQRSILLDVAMSVAPRGKIGLQLAQGQALPPGWILDAQGRASVDPADLVAGLGVPIGGHKGYGLALVFEVLSALLAGAGFGSSHLRSQLRSATSADIGHFFLAFDPGLFGSALAFRERVDQLIEHVKGCRRAATVAEILLPGESELRERERSFREGVALSPATLTNLEKHARRYGIPGRGFA